MPLKVLVYFTHCQGPNRPDFSLFPVKFPFWKTLKKFQWFPKSEKQKKKKSPQLFSFLFHPYISNFPHFYCILYNFSSFSSFAFFFFSFSFTFSIFIFFSLPHLSRLVAKNFPVESLRGHFAPCPPPPACYATVFT